MDITLETDRLTLKILKPDHAAAVLRFYKRNRLWFEPFEPVHPPNFYTVEYQENTLSIELNEYLHRKYLRLYLFLKNNTEAEIIGSVCFNHLRYNSFFSCSLGYKLDHDYWSKGYMKEALYYCIHSIMFREYNMHRIEADVMPSNIASCRLLQAIGFQPEGILKDYAYLQGRWQDHLRYAIIDRENTL